MNRRTAAASVSVAIATTVTCLIPLEAAHASDPYDEVRAVNCGTLDAKRSATLRATGSFDLDVRPTSYTFRWDNHRSTLSYNACGPAAPYGPYLVNAKAQKLTTEFIVAQASLTGCDVSGKKGISTDKDGVTTARETSESCTIRSRVAKEMLITSGVKNKAARLVNGGSIEMKGGFCNSVKMRITGSITDPDYGFAGNVVKIDQGGKAC